MTKIIKPETISKDEIKRLLNFVSMVSNGEGVDLMFYVDPCNDYKKGWNEAIAKANIQIGNALYDNNLDVDGESGIVYSKEWFTIVRDKK